MVVEYKMKLKIMKGFALCGRQSEKIERKLAGGSYQTINKAREREITLEDW